MGFVIAGAGALAGGIMGSQAAKKAGQQQASAIGQGVDFQKGVYADTTANLSPFISGGTNALAAVAQLLGLPSPAGTNLPAGNALSGYQSFMKTPFYQFPLQQGSEALNRSGAARGLNLSGGQLNALQQYGAGYASSNFDKYVGALANLANLGESSGASLGQLGNSAAGNVLQGQTGIGNALAAGTIGAQNQINNALSVLPQLLGYGPNPTGGTNNTGSSYGGGTGNNPLRSGNSSNLVNALTSLFSGGGSASGGAIGGNFPI